MSQPVHKGRGQDLAAMINSHSSDQLPPSDPSNSTSKRQDEARRYNLMLSSGSTNKPGSGPHSSTRILEPFSSPPKSFDPSPTGYQPPVQRPTSSSHSLPFDNTNSARDTVTTKSYEERPRKKLMKASDIARDSSSRNTSPTPNSVPSSGSPPRPDSTRESSPGTKNARTHLAQFQFKSGASSRSSSEAPSPYPEVAQHAPGQANDAQVPSPPVSTRRAGSNSRPIILDDEDDSPVKKPSTSAPGPPVNASTPQASPSAASSAFPSPSSSDSQILRAYMERAHYIKRSMFPQLDISIILNVLYQYKGRINQTSQVLRQKLSQTMPVQQPTAKAYIPPVSPGGRSSSQRVVDSSPVAPPKKKVKRMPVESDSEDSANYDSEGSELYEDNEAQKIKEEKALQFFNSCKASDIPDLTACSPKQAELIISLRPFESVEDLRMKLRKQKGVTAGILDSYMSIMDGYEAVDEVFQDCEKHGYELSEIIHVWNGDVQISADTSLAGTPSSTRPGTPDTEGGLHIAGVPEPAKSPEKVNSAVSSNSKPHIKAAFESFIQKKPSTMADNVTLKDYQLFGLNWLNLLYRRNTSCILADEMGLGKTIQVIALFAHLKETKAPGPHLVIVPSSTLENWIREFSVFAPGLDIACYYGTQSERFELRQELKAREDLDVVVTTYNMATGAVDDRKFLRKMEFQTCIYDEGHQLKNSQSKKYKDLMEIRVNWRCLLTGTPLQNNLQELVSLLSFILPNIFSRSSESLRAIFKVPADAQSNLLTRKRIQAAKRVMTPFVLRRKKIQVLKDLPDKNETVEYCEMRDVQKDLYREALLRSRKVLLEAEESQIEQLAAGDVGDNEATNSSSMNKLASKTGKITKAEQSSANVLMELRKAANHPMLFRRLYTNKQLKSMARDCLREVEFMDRNMDYIYEDMEVMTDFELHQLTTQYKNLQKYSLKNEEWMEAGKIDVLRRILPELKKNGHRVLLFSQFTQVLDILQKVLQTLDYKYMKLTGQTPVGERQVMVDEFSNDPEIFVFLLSTRAGGLGLNLMAADTVLIYDQDFNPHNDRQAADRAWRIGQTRDVNVMKLVTKETIEEDILGMAETKMKLDQSVSNIEGESSKATELAAAANTKGNAGGQVDEEGEEVAVERKMKSSLLKTLRQRFEGEQGEAFSQSQNASPKKK